MNPFHRVFFRLPLRLVLLGVLLAAIGASGTAWLSRVMRGNLLDVLNMQYVQTARSKGLKEPKVIWKHAVRNALHRWSWSSA